MDKKQELFLETVGEKQRQLVRGAFEETVSPRQAIKAHCFLCSGQVIADAAACTVTTCALWTYNLYRVKEVAGPSSEG